MPGPIRRAAAQRRGRLPDTRCTLHRKVQLSYTLAAQRSDEAPIRHALMDLLQAVRQHGSITAAARSLGFSYRHVWGELRRWEARLDRPLVLWERGQPARLAEFGDKLLWAERQAQARLSAQIEALQAELERAFAVAFDDAVRVLTFHASHDDALSLLREHAANAAQLHLDIRFCGSVDAIRALNDGRCTMAGFHTLETPARGTLAQRTYQPLLRPGQHKIIGFARRTQGLMVAPGNPLAISALADLAGSPVRFANRGLGTGTRLLLDQLLEQQRIDVGAITGYERIEPSHAAAAQAVADGSADAALGIESAATSRGLAFVPLTVERYHLVCTRPALLEPAVQALIVLLDTAAWQRRLDALAGYRAADSGRVLSLSKLLPWWDFSSKTARKR